MLRKININDKLVICKLIREGLINMNQLCVYKTNKTDCSTQNINNYFKEYMQKKHFFYGIEEKKEIVAFLHGYVTKYPLCKGGFIDFIVVSKNHQGKGYSTQLRNTFYNWLKNKKINYCTLHVLENNKRAAAIYKKWGFGTSGLMMAKKI